MKLPAYVIHWNAPHWCKSSVLSLLRSDHTALELCVVDNGQLSGPRLASLLPPEVRIMRMPKNSGYAGAANAAIKDFLNRYERCDYVLIGSHDLHVEPSTLSSLVKAADADPGLGVVAPVLVGPDAPSSGASYGVGGSIHHPLVQEREVVLRDWASGTCLMFRRACLYETGSFDERFGSYVEDVDICLRARDAGWKVGVATGAVAWGLGSSSADSWSRMEANRVLLGAKRFGFRGAMRALSQVATWAGRSAVGSLTPWRAKESRRQSRVYLARHMKAIRMVPWKATVGEVVPRWSRPRAEKR